MGFFKNLFSGFKKAFEEITATIGNRTYGGSHVEEKKTSLSSFIDMIQRNFGFEYEIKTGVTTKEVIGVDVSDAKAYDVCLFKDGRIVLAMLLTDHNKDRNKYFINAKTICLDNNIKFLNFYSHYPNEESYVVSRINETLNNF